MRTKIYNIIEVAKPGDFGSRLYDIIMMSTIILSLVPLTFKQTNPLFECIENITVIIFIIDYLLRLYTADLKLKKGPYSFFLYPFSLMAIIDLLSILPSFSPLSGGFKILKIFRFFRTMRIFRAFRYSKNINVIINVIKKQKAPLLAVCSLAIGYVVISALIIFNVEPDTFDTFFDAIYWATVSLTTMGYGDIYPTTTFGRVVTMLSSFIGIAIVALPAGIITAGYMDIIQDKE